MEDSKEEAVHAQREMPRYRSHKVVHALKILDVRQSTNPGPNEEEGGPHLIVEPPFRPVFPGRRFFEKHDPKAGGYFVVYEDGYRSFSPAKAFEEGYTRI